jgi:hypothetical protein
MATLTGDKLIGYLDRLVIELKEKQNQTDNSLLSNLMHEQMIDIICAEKELLEYNGSNGVTPTLAFSGGGFPSLESLVPDLEAMSQLSDKSSDENNKPQSSLFNKVISSYKPEGILPVENSSIYKNVSQEEWRNFLKKYETKDLIVKPFFDVSETKDGKFNLSFREEVFLDGVNAYCENHPLLIRGGNMTYNVVWDFLFDNSEEYFYAPNIDELTEKKGEIVLANNAVVPFKEKLFDDVFHKYKLKPNNFDYTLNKFLFWNVPVLPSKYNNLIIAGIGIRSHVTNNVTNILSEILGSKVYTSGYEGELNEFLSFKNTQESKLFPTDSFKSQLTLFINNRGIEKEIGSIGYTLPSKSYYDGSTWLGNISVNVNGGSFDSYDQFFNVKKLLKRRHIFSGFEPTQR